MIKECRAQDFPAAVTPPMGTPGNVSPTAEFAGPSGTSEARKAFRARTVFANAVMQLLVGSELCESSLSDLAKPTYVDETGNKVPLLTEERDDEDDLEKGQLDQEELDLLVLRRGMGP
eukprot:2446624-Rhodomonas_salina.1